MPLEKKEPREVAASEALGVATIDTKDTRSHASTQEWRPRAPVERAMARVEIDRETGCWIFRGALNEGAYGIVGLGGCGAGCGRAHRVTYRHFRVDIPDNLHVCDRCDVPACCNPDHLFLGTAADNMADCWAKGRAARPPAARLSDSQVLRIRELALRGIERHAIADEFVLSAKHLRRILSGESWAHVR